jgi:hypothetical protein
VVSDEATSKIIAAIALLTAPRPAPGEVPAWAKGTWVHPMSFQSGMMRHESAPSKPIAEMTREGKISLFMASRGRAYRRGVW